MDDQIRLNAVRVATFIGVPDEERQLPQTLEIDVTLIPQDGFAGAGDEIEGTVDYFAVWNQVREVAAERPRKLLETLAEDLANAILENPAIRKVGIEVRKFILPMTGSVSVTIWRERHL